MKRKKEIIEPEYYDSLDAPVFVWQKVHETQDLSYLLVKRQPAEGHILVLLAHAWEKIYDEFIAVFGFSEAFLEIKRKEISIALMQLDLIISGDRSIETFIEIEQQELSEMQKDIGKAGFGDSKKAIEKDFKFQINMRTTSIREFYDYLKDLK